MRYPIVYRYVYGLLKREVGNGNLIHISKIHSIVKWVIRFPRRYQREVIADLIDCGLLKRLDRDNYEILTCRIKPPCDSLGDPLF